MSRNTPPRHTYHRRLFIGLVAYSVILTACFAVFQYTRERAFKADELNLQLQDVNERILGMVEQGDLQGVRTLTPPSQFSDMRVSVISREGRVVLDTSLDSLPGTNHLDRKEISDALAHGRGFTTRRHSSSTGQTYFYSAMAGGNWVVRTAVPYSMGLHQLLAADYGFLWVIFGITVVMCTVGYFVTRRLGQNVSRLNRFAERAERGERITDTEAFPHDELGEISNHVVRLYARLQKAIADRDREHRRSLHEEKEKIRIKRQLTNNINHELKTPVASMQVCLETMLAHPEMAADKRTEFLARCYAANERLRNLLDDVSAITRLEDGGDHIARTAVDLSQVVRRVCDELRVEAAEAGITIADSVTYSQPIPGNEGLLESVVRNLLTNAIKYSGGSEVEVTQSVGERFITVTVADNGIGVDPEHLPRLFERFYRVDKGRSRRQGGTGLGLSIVKNAVLWHGGSVEVSNRPGGGLRFIFQLPLR